MLIIKSLFSWSVLRKTLEASCIVPAASLLCFVILFFDNAASHSRAFLFRIFGPTETTRIFLLFWLEAIFIAVLQLLHACINDVWSLSLWEKGNLVQLIGRLKMQEQILQVDLSYLLNKSLNVVMNHNLGVEHSWSTVYFALYVICLLRVTG